MEKTNRIIDALKKEEQRLLKERGKAELGSVERKVYNMQYESIYRTLQELGK